MNIFDQYGIREVADVTLYSIHKKKDGSGDVYYVPALYLDTLKISSIEKTAENVWAQGGLGNARLICWDYGKQINITLEDALCTPASLGLCWGGILGADWKNGEIHQDFGISFDNHNPVERLSRIEKSFYPKNDREKATISNLLPRLKDEYNLDDTVLMRSSIVDGTEVKGFGYVKNRPYKWKMAIESSIKSIAVIPDRYFDINGKSHPINYKKPIEITTPTYGNRDFSVVYSLKDIDDTTPIKPPSVIILDRTDTELPEDLNSFEKVLKIQGNYFVGCPCTGETKTFYAGLNLCSNKKLMDNNGNEIADSKWVGKIYKDDGEEIIEITSAGGINGFYHSSTGDVEWGTIKDSTLNIEPIIMERVDSLTMKQIDIVSTEEIDTTKSDYLKVVIDNNNDYSTYLSSDKINWIRTEKIDTTQFKNLDLWIRFNSINEQIYFILTKYENDIFSIKSIINTGNMEDEYKQTENTSKDAIKNNNSLWAYVNPKTMKPYPDDYWFHQGEPYYIKSLTLAPKNKKLKSQRIQITAGQFPGMYMLVGETYIRSRDTGEDERMQIKIPLCKVKSDQNITLEAEGEPTVFNMNIEVARPINGIMMELTSYEIAEKIMINDQGFAEIKDGSTEILSE